MKFTSFFFFISLLTMKEKPEINAIHILDLLMYVWVHWIWSVFVIISCIFFLIFLFQYYLNVLNACWMTVSSAHLKIGMFQNSNILKMLPLRFLKHCKRSLTNMTVAETIAIFTYTFFSFHFICYVWVSSDFSKLNDWHWAFAQP